MPFSKSWLFKLGKRIAPWTFNFPKVLYNCELVHVYNRKSNSLSLFLKKKSLLPSWQRPGWYPSSLLLGLGALWSELQLEKNGISGRRPGSWAWTSRCQKPFQDRAFLRYQRPQLQNCPAVCLGQFGYLFCLPLCRMGVHIQCLSHRVVEKIQYINICKALRTVPGTKYAP